MRDFDIKQCATPCEVLAIVLDYRYLPANLVWLNLAIDSFKTGGNGIDTAQSNTFTITTNATDLHIENAELVAVKYDGAGVVTVEVVQ